LHKVIIFRDKYLARYSTHKIRCREREGLANMNNNIADISPFA
jgi:hypothetical protein